MSQHKVYTSKPTGDTLHGVPRTEFQFIDSENDEFIEVVVIPISDVSGNVITAESDGLFVPQGAVSISADEGNIIEQRDDGLYATGGEGSGTCISTNANNVIERDVSNCLLVDITKLISADADNAIELGDDNRLHVTITDASCLSDESVNAITLDTNGCYLLDPANLVSTDSGNEIEVGNDGKIKVVQECLTAPIQRGTDGCIELDFEGLISGDTNNQIEIGDDGKLKVIIEESEEAFMYLMPLYFDAPERELWSYIPLDATTAQLEVTSIVSDDTTLVPATAQINMIGKSTTAGGSSINVGTTVVNLTDQAGKWVNITFTSTFPAGGEWVAATLVLR